MDTPETETQETQNCIPPFIQKEPERKHLILLISGFVTGVAATLTALKLLS